MFVVCNSVGILAWFLTFSFFRLEMKCKGRSMNDVDRNYKSRVKGEERLFLLKDKSDFEIALYTNSL